MGKINFFTFFSGAEIGIEGRIELLMCTLWYLHLKNVAALPTGKAAISFANLYSASYEQKISA